MNLKNLNKKAQSLPLNTIVIAILVVIVLLIIIVAFTDGFTGSNRQISEATSCSSANPSLKDYKSIDEYSPDQCTGDLERIYTVQVEDKDKVCCAIKNN